jgi:hypothetical protein
MAMTTLKYVALHGRSPTGLVRYTFAGVDVGTAATLRIVQYDGAPGFYLIHLDEEGREIADTYHDTIEDALEQAELEFAVKPQEWLEWTD